VIRLDYGTDDDKGEYIGPWLLLSIARCSTLLDPSDALGLASRLREAAQIVEDRARARRERTAG
jgi:hypothetical protein